MPSNNYLTSATLEESHFAVLLITRHATSPILGLAFYLASSRHAQSIAFCKKRNNPSQVRIFIMASAFSRPIPYRFMSIRYITTSRRLVNTFPCQKFCIVLRLELSSRKEAESSTVHPLSEHDFGSNEESKKKLNEARGARILLLRLSKEPLAFLHYTYTSVCLCVGTEDVTPVVSFESQSLNHGRNPATVSFTSAYPDRELSTHLALGALSPDP